MSDYLAYYSERRQEWKDCYGSKETGVESFLSSSAVCRPHKNLTGLTTSQKHIFVVEDEGGSIVGIASGGPARDSEPRYRGEIYVLYLLQAAQRQGIGRKLVAAVAQYLAQQQLPGMIIWVLADNPACQFYEALGGIYLRDKTVVIGGKPLREVAYSWQDTRRLIAQ